MLRGSGPRRRGSMIAAAHPQGSLVLECSLGEWNCWRALVTARARACSGVVRGWADETTLADFSISAPASMSI
jgi:hypothetical protein